MTAVRLYEATDANPARLSDKTVAVIGFGSQGHAHALNLHDSGVTVVVGSREDSKTGARAAAAGLRVARVEDAVKAAEIVALLIPDMAQAAVYQEQIAPHLRSGTTLLFAHGFNVHYGQIHPDPALDVIMVAPKAPGAMVRDEFCRGRGVPALVAVHQDMSGGALETALAYGAALGCGRAGMLETTFREETETDLFGEQAVLCGGVTSLICNGFETLVDAGYPAELAYFECLHELKLIVDLIQRRGLGGMRAEVSDTAEFGDYVGGPRVVNETSRHAMETLLSEIRSGQFAERWLGDGRSGHAELNRLRCAAREHEIERVGSRLRARMPWLKEPA